ncbi:serine-rich glycoprotein adhesin [Limosilactobacillus kribbianus]|uniref:serine-rich glycoprotein adhesin n=1 Tax=Limosilactobacillus kribbianus TaxID=2982695 RepID=UPI002264AEFF|nr:serine-rich glycoprotein adhesin [Limosilactobacillus kribbianus]
MTRKEDHEEKYSKVKMYKTHQGWVSCLTRFFSILHFSKKVETKGDSYADPDELDGRFSDTVDSYLKGLGLRECQEVCVN